MSWAEGIEWTRPAGLLLLLWIVAIVWRLRRKDAPRELATGTLALWRVVTGEGAVVTADQKRHVPPRAWLWFLGLLAGSLAVLDPLAMRAPTTALYVFQMDRSPSMYLPFEQGGTTTRYERALQSALECLQTHSIPGDAREWRTRGQAAVRADQPPQEWALAPKLAQAELSPECHADEHLTLLTDRSIESAGGLIASGGAQALGWVAEFEGRALLWDGLLVRESDPLPPRSVAPGKSISGDLAELFGIWARERGHALVSAGEAQYRYELGQGLSGDPLDPRVVWLEARSTQELSTDPAFWAVQWAEILDEALPVRAGIVSLAERRAAGTASQRLGLPLETLQPSPGTPASAWLALSSLLCALGAFWPRSGSSRAPIARKGPAPGLADGGTSL